ncbi:hypothetical protein ANCCAN_28127 [Ancylostoma caninum]|uniref:Uncharacterized protein n=1 Tax=Ancylostoma caninum TaxID=29170 RepID=A0A368F239_ANCCA|nr:hypothetical protein ANCCAN_28127 [Ancylostoma caninum]
MHEYCAVNVKTSFICVNRWIGDSKGATDRAVSEKPPTGEEPEILVVESPYNVEAFGRKNIAFTSSAKKRKATGDRSFVEGESCIVYESSPSRQVKKLKQMRKSADVTSAKCPSSSEACSNRDCVDLDAILSRRRFADWSWDIEQDNVAPATKRLRSDDDVKLTKDKWEKPEAALDGQHLCEHLDSCEHSVPLLSTETTQENTVQIFPQTVPLYMRSSQANDFSYCDRSAFSRHLFF